MSQPSDFPLAVVAAACDGAASLRDRLAAHGLDTATVAALLGTSPLTIARASRSGATPRGVLIGMAGLVTTLDRLAEHGITAGDIAGGARNDDDAVREVAAQSTLAWTALERLRRMPATSAGPAQLVLRLPKRAAA